MEETPFYLIRARSPLLDIESTEYDNFIATNESFKLFCQDVFDLEGSDPLDPVFLRYVQYFDRVAVHLKKTREDRQIQGIEKLIDLPEGKVKIGYTRVRENLIYVEHKGKYLRGYQVFWADLCLVNAMNFVPLDKSVGNGNIEILQWNKRKATKGVRFIHNKIQSIMYAVDAEFATKEEMQQDIDNPKELNLTLLIAPML